METFSKEEQEEMVLILKAVNPLLGERLEKMFLEKYEILNTGIRSFFWPEENPIGFRIVPRLFAMKIYTVHDLVNTPRTNLQFRKSGLGKSSIQFIVDELAKVDLKLLGD